MLDTPAPAIAAFDLVAPLPLNLNENLYLLGASRWQKCRSQWLELVAHHWPSTSREWWDARAPFSAQSRRDLALTLYRQHFEAACQVACAEGRISREQMQWLSTVSDPSVPLAPDVHLTRPAFNDDGPSLPGAVKVSLMTGQSATHLLYVPSHAQALMRFERLADLGQWLFDQRRPASTTPTAPPITLEYLPLNGDALERSLSTLLFQALGTGGLNLTPLFAEAPTLPLTEADSTDDPPPFGQLNPDIAQGSRSAAVARQHAALDHLLGKDISVAKDHPALLTLQRQFATLSRAEEASHTAAVALFESCRAQQFLELRHSSNVHGHALHQARLDGLRAEADLQRTLSQLNEQEHQRIIALLDAAGQTARPPGVEVARIILSSNEDEENLSQELDGVLLISATEDADRSVLLYWPGRFGGLQRFDSRPTMEATLFKRSLADRNTAIRFEPLSSDPFAWTLQQQLYQCEQQAIRIIHENRDPDARANALENLRAMSIPLLTVPMVASRELAFEQRREQDTATQLAGSLPTWLSRLDDARRIRCKALIDQYLRAIQHASALCERELPQRDVFSQQRIDERLRKDFSLQQPASVSLTVPESTSWQKVVMEGAGPGTPQRNVLIASPARNTLTLGELAQGNIDQAMWWRLSFMQINVSSSSAKERQTLTSSLTLPYLRNLVSDLDLAGNYEKLICRTFFGSPSASTFDTAWRRECLSEPWRLLLKLQGEFALQQGLIDAQGLRVLEIATRAPTDETNAIDAKNIVLLPAHLTAGGTDSVGQGPTTLAGVTFIVEQTSGLTLRYLPDNPDDNGLRQFDSLEQARLDLFNRCTSNRMVDYLAERAVAGNVASHVRRINESQLRNFNALIGVGPQWPASTSLSTHLLNVHMGRLLQAHRDSSRSNDALYLEHKALESGRVFNLLKMMLGLVPVAGAAIGLHDAWNSANLAVAAFLRGDTGEGLAQVESLLLALVDAAMDVLPGAATGTDSLRAMVRGVTRRRHLTAALTAPGALQPGSRRETRRVHEYFKGYEYEHEISLADLQPGSHGIYRNVYRHADGDFIVHEGRAYRVQLSDTHQGWRLAGTRARTYKMPVALDESGQWNTHYAVHGTLMNGGGAGGGAVLGHLADGMDPLWPEAIRRWLPRWWIDRHLRRQLTLTNTADAHLRRLDSQTRSTNARLKHYYDLPASERQPRRESLDNACVNDIDIAENGYRNLDELLPLSHGRKRTQIEDLRSRSAWVVTDRSIHRIQFTRERLIEHLDQINRLLNLSDTTPGTDTRRHLALMKERKTVRHAFVRDFDQAHSHLEQVNHWHRRITHRDHKAQIAADVATVNKTLSPANLRYLKCAHLLELISRPDAIDDTTWMYFHTQLKAARTEVGRALFTQHNLTNVRASAVQRQRVLEDCLVVYEKFRRQLNAWTLGYPQHLDFDFLVPFLDNLENVEAFARDALRTRTPIAATEPAGGKRLFETEDNRLLVGVEHTDPLTRQKRLTIDGADGHTETWLPRSSGKYQLVEPLVSAPPAPSPALQPLLTEARKRLASAPAYQDKVDGYALQNMLPVDLEHMLLSEASELSLRAETLERLTPHEPLLAQLNDQARAFRRYGRSLRIEQSMNSKTPTEGYLDYLLEQRVVEVRKEGGLRDLGKRPDGARDYLQEYEVRDLTRQPPQTLWYAHFHYRSAKTPFNDFAKAHLKLPAQRNSGLQWQQAQARSGIEVESIWRGDIGKSMALKHFATTG